MERMNIIDVSSGVMPQRTHDYQKPLQNLRSSSSALPALRCGLSETRSLPLSSLNTPTFPACRGPAQASQILCSRRKAS